MRFSRKNKRPMWYSNLTDSEPIYALDDNGDKIVADTIDGVVYYVEIGQSEYHYEDPIYFEGTIETGGKRNQLTAYGIDISEYETILVLPTNSSPINEKTLIWVDNEPTEATEDTADYVIAKKCVALNTTYFLLKANPK